VEWYDRDMILYEMAENLHAGQPQAKHRDLSELVHQQILGLVL
jgi:hypothetical protein